MRKKIDPALKERAVSGAGAPGRVSDRDSCCAGGGQGGEGRQGEPASVGRPNRYRCWGPARCHDE